MKHIYIIIFFLFSLTSFSQDEIFGEWTLSYMTIDGEIHNNTFHTIVPSINFSDEYFDYYPELEGYQYYGMALCNGYGGIYTIDSDDTITFKEFYTTLIICDDMPEGSDFFEWNYFDFLWEAGMDTTIFTYEITGTGNDAVLTLTNTHNNNVAVYGRQTLSATDLVFNKSTIKLKENPVKEQLQLKLDNQDYRQLSYTIYSIDGKCIAETKPLENNSIDVYNISPGLYFIRMETDDNKTQTLKFIKE